MAGISPSAILSNIMVYSRLVVACRLREIMLFIHQNYLSLIFSAILVSKVAVILLLVFSWHDSASGHADGQEK